MAFQWHLIVFTFLLNMFNITEYECREMNKYGFNETLEQASQIITEFPLGLSEVFDDASGVFGKVLGKMITKKKFLGIESFYFRK